MANKEFGNCLFRHLTILHTIRVRLVKKKTKTFVPYNRHGVVAKRII